MKLKPSRYHVASFPRISGAGPAQARLRTLEAGRGKASSQGPQATLVTQPKIAPPANKVARAMQLEYPERPFGCGRAGQPAQEWRQIGGPARV
jgi:hypothetical protein